MISETARRVQPWYRDRGVQASIALTAGVWGFNEFWADSAKDQLSGLLAAAPVLAAVLVQRASRVLIATGVALAAFFLSALDVPFDASQVVRLVAILLMSFVGLLAAESRLKNVSRLLAIGEVAKTAQLAIMRMTPPEAEGVDAAVRYVSASTEANIGGDAYEAVLTPFGLRVLVADARGKGIPAVLPSAVAVGAFREWAFVEEDLGDLISRMDASVAREVGDADFVTALVAEFRDDMLRYACAGHPRPLLLREGSARELDVVTCPPLSLVSPYVTPKVSAMRMRKDDVVLMFSDGLTDSRNSDGDFFEVPATLMRVAEYAVSVEECADGVLKELRDFVAGDLEDDVALVALRITKPVESLPEDESEQD
ncbi:MAG TPA: PP2C family protein-serine/threonine phosphatase [Actinomycetes bacterium]|nr:PP2C family protein-serine/threonine phosphatase [Actinomycetes bacterium]